MQIVCGWLSWLHSLCERSSHCTLIQLAYRSSTPHTQQYKWLFAQTGSVVYLSVYTTVFTVHKDRVCCVSQCVYHCVHTDRVCRVSQCVYHCVHTDRVYCVSQCVYHCVHTDRVCRVSQCVYHCVHCLCSDGGSESVEEEDEEETPATPTASGNPWLTHKGVGEWVGG